MAAAAVCNSDSDGSVSGSSDTTGAAGSGFDASGNPETAAFTPASTGLIDSGNSAALDFALSDWASGTSDAVSSAPAISGSNTSARSPVTANSGSSTSSASSISSDFSTSSASPISSGSSTSSASSVFSGSSASSACSSMADSTSQSSASATNRASPCPAPSSSSSPLSPAFTGDVWPDSRPELFFSLLSSRTRSAEAAAS